MVIRRTGYVYKTANHVLYMTKNPNPTAAPEGFGARLGAEGVTLGTPIHAHPRGEDPLPITATLCSASTGPHVPQATLTMKPQPSPGAQHPGAGECFWFSAAKWKLFSVEISPPWLHSPVSVGYSRVLLKSFCAWGICRTPFSLCVLLGLINS